MRDERAAKYIRKNGLTTVSVPLRAPISTTIGLRSLRLLSRGSSPQDPASASRGALSDQVPWHNGSSEGRTRACRVAEAEYMETSSSKKRSK